LFAAIEGVRLGGSSALATLRQAGFPFGASTFDAFMERL
jgi:hypothetical protein